MDNPQPTPQKLDPHTHSPLTIPSFQKLPYNKYLQHKISTISLFNFKKNSNIPFAQTSKIPLEIKRFRLTPNGKATLGIASATAIVIYIGLVI